MENTTVKSNEDQAQAMHSLHPTKRDGEEIELDLEEKLNLIQQDIATFTVRNIGHGNSTENSITEETSLSSICEIIKSDRVGAFLKTLERGNIDITDSLGSLQLTPLHLAALLHSPKILEYLIQNPNVFVNYPSKDMDTPLLLGILGAHKDESAIEIIRIFSKHKDLNIFRKNQQNLFPLLISVQKGFTGASKLLLTSPVKNAINKYETYDLIRVIKLARVKKLDTVNDFIHLNLSPRRRMEILDEIGSNIQGNDLLDDVIRLLEQSLLREQTLTGQNSSNKTVKPLRKQETIKSGCIDSKSMNTTEDASGNKLRVGNIVKTLSAFNVQRALPARAKHSDVLKLAEKTATIHKISGDKVYMEIHGGNCVTTMKAEAVVYYREGETATIGDGSSVHIGCIVQVLSNERDVKSLTGSNGWVHGMEETCGKTGKIVRILKNSDILVQFAWGPRYFLNPNTLKKSSIDTIVTQDHKYNWIAVGSLVLINKPQSEFLKLQRKNHLPHEGTYETLPWKFAVVKQIQIRAFSSSKSVQIAYNESKYIVNVDSLELVTWIKDRKGNDLSISDEVKVINNEVELKSGLGKSQGGLQSDVGDWVDIMSEYVGQIGTIVDLVYKKKSDPGEHDALVKVEFPDSSSFFLNPRSVEIFLATIGNQTEASYVNTMIHEHYTTAPQNAESSRGAETEDHWELIDRSNLNCGQLLGEGGMGRVVCGEWMKNGIRKNVAIKQIKVGLAQKQQFFDGFVNEAKIQFSLRHPNIVPLLGISLRGDRDLWIVMDFVDGTDLYSLLFQNDSAFADMRRDQKLSICLDMSNAIAYMHQRGYLHADIKPHNMMVDKAGKLYVCDFGVTQFLDVEQYATQYTNNLYGTMFYLPPECLQLDEETGKYRKPKFPADIWALGAVFFELFTGLHIYDNHAKFLHDKMNNVDTEVKERMKDLSQSIRPIVSRALNFDRYSRPNAQELCEFFYELTVQRS